MFVVEHELCKDACVHNMQFIVGCNFRDQCTTKSRLVTVTNLLLVQLVWCYVLTVCPE